MAGQTPKYCGLVTKCAAFAALVCLAASPVRAEESAAIISPSGVMLVSKKTTPKTADAPAADAPSKSNNPPRKLKGAEQSLPIISGVMKVSMEGTVSRGDISANKF